MPLHDTIRSNVLDYARSDLPGDLAWHVAYFSFISNEELRGRIGQEFYAARCLYKLWEGLRIGEAWATQAQVQLQVQQYASIYEASIHHLLFTEAVDEPVVQRLFEYEALVQRDLPGFIMDKVGGLNYHDAGEIVGAVRAKRRTQESKIRFDRKVEAAVELEILDPELGREIAAFYTARNYIHIHAELSNKDVEWHVSFARDAYRRLAPFKAQASEWLLERQRSGGGL